MDQKQKMMGTERSNLEQQTAYLKNLGKKFGFDKGDFNINPEMNENQGNVRWTPPKIIYTSRTHSQLTQAVKELKNSAYNNVLAVSLGSRDQLCINSEVIKEAKSSSEKNTLCLVKIRKRGCSYKERNDKVASRTEVVSMPIKDIEDLVTIGNKCRACPYYLARDLAQQADVIFMPYNYLLDARILKNFQLDLTGAVIILDEAHNVEKVCEDSASILFASSDITSCIQDITHLMKVLEKDEDLLMMVDDEVEKDFTLEDLANLKEIMLKFEDAVDSIGSVFQKQGKTFPGGKLFELLEAASINKTTYQSVRDLMDTLVTYLAQSSAGNVFGRRGNGVAKMQEVIETAFSGLTNGDFDQYKKEMERGYRVHVEIEPDKKSRPDTTVNVWLPSGQTKLSKSPKIINYWCFDPGYGMANVLAKNVRSIILTSGTLAPLKPLISELALRVEHRLENPHIIKSSQVAVKIVSSGPDKELLDGAYQNRDNPKYIKSLGLSIQGICRVTPHGVLVFFSSYTLMNKCNEEWEKSGLLQDLKELKPIFMEPRSKDEFHDSIKSYYESVQSRKGAIYMAVLRGKVSEGLDFNDNNARAVFICGIPFPPYLDPRVTLKQSYLEQNRTKENQLQSGREWYTLEAVRAVNQAIGRVIRHKDDFGAILLCDHRFHYYKTLLSRWIQPHLNAQSKADSNSFGKIVGELARFFRNAESTCPPPKLRSIDEACEIKNDESTKIDTSKIIKSQIKLENSNEMYSNSNLVKEKSSEDVAEYKKYVDQLNTKKTSSNKSLFGGLSQDISVIDFNSSEPSSSSSFKTPRPKDFSNEDENLSKKPRLKMIPNANVFPDEVKKEEEEIVEIRKSDWKMDYPNDKAKFLGEVNWY